MRRRICAPTTASFSGVNGTHTGKQRGRETLNIKVRAPDHVQFGHKLVQVPLPAGLPDADEIEAELLGYCNVLLGREDPPVQSPYLQLAEIAVAYYARAQELTMLIHIAEREGSVVRGHPLYRVRTGVLRDFLDMAKEMAALGSRRLTQETLLFQQRRDAGEAL